jgi:hypothetical protein
MGLYEKVLAERAEEEHRRGRLLGTFRGLNSAVLDRRLANAPENRPGYGADVHRLYQYVHRGVHIQAGAISLDFSLRPPRRGEKLGI